MNNEHLWSKLGKQTVYMCTLLSLFIRDVHLRIHMTSETNVFTWQHSFLSFWFGLGWTAIRRCIVILFVMDVKGRRHRAWIIRGTIVVNRVTSTILAFSSWRIYLCICVCLHTTTEIGENNDEHSLLPGKKSAKKCWSRALRSSNKICFHKISQWNASLCQS